jgi:outer membrane autotransporter protein
VGQQTGIAYAKGKYNVEAFNLEAAVGYNHKTNAGTLTPYVGINLGRVNDINYIETGAGVQNREVKQNASHSKSVIAGAAFATRSNWDDMEVLPEAHVNLRYGVGAKTPKGQYKLVGTNGFANYAGHKPSNLSINVGGSVTSYVDNIEYGVGYDAHIADKYVGHQGSLKIKVKF